MDAPPSSDICQKIDHTFLKIDSDSTVAKLEEGAVLVSQWNLRSFIVPPQLVRTTAKNYPNIRVGTVAGFPLGFETLAEKVFSCQQALEDGAREVDVVLDLFALVNGNFNKIFQETDILCELARRNNFEIKFILEMSILNRQQIEKAVEACKKAKAFAVKTGTGYYRTPVTAGDVALLKELAGDELLVKAAGGIDSLSRVNDLISAGADIIGTSHTSKILSELSEFSQLAMS